MQFSISALFVFLLVLCQSFFITETTACGCYGPTSCSPRGIQCKKGLFTYMNEKDPCICDCCLACNTCDQLLAGCAREPNNDIEFSPGLKSLRLNRPIEPRTLVPKSNSGTLGLWGEPCIEGDIPAGLNLTYDGDAATFVLTGTPTERGKTKLAIVARGGGGVVHRVDVKINVK
ncbi:hypothetical protein DFJ77DRAFT_469741 [Powellomyces hirtus]|nr:hypothetical protein DFJ77DRAFT_469741 [Powellomyces hirtus]